MTVLNAAQKTTLRSRPHRTRLYLSFYQPRTVFQCQVNNAAAARSDMDITFDNVTVGTYTNALAGMTVFVGSTQGAKDKGRLRVRKATAVNTLYVAENDDVQWADNLWLTVVNYYEPWGVYPNIVLDASNIPTFYKDWDLTYSDQNSILDPIPIMGPNRAGMLESSTGLYGAYFDGSNSYDLNSGGTITSYAWTFESGSMTIYSAATPGWVYWNTPGHYVVSLTVTNNQGKTFTGRRHISVYNRYSGPSVPIRNFMIDDMNGDYARGGWSCRFRLRESVPQSLLDDGTLVVVFAEDWYAGVKGSLGGNYLNAEDIVFTGYLMEDSIEIDPYTSEVVAEAVGISLRLDVSEIFSVSIKSVVTPTTWYQLKSMTVDKAMQHYLRWHTTVYTVADVRKNGNTFGIEQADFPKDVIRSALDGLLSSALIAHFVVDRQGQVWMETKTNVVPVGSRTLGTTMSIAAHDWRDRISIRRRRRSEISYVEVGGIYYAGPATGSFQAIISSAPGNTPKYHGREQIINGLALSDQTTNNQLAGDIIAMLNSEFPEVRLQLSGNYRVFDIAPQERCLLIVYPDDNQWRLNWFEKNFIPRSISFAYDRQDEMLLVDIVLEEETDGIPGVTGPYPAAPPDDVVDYDTTPITFPEVPPIPVVVPGQGDGGTVYVVTTTRIGGTDNFLAASPNYINLTGAVTGTILDFILDPWDPANKAWVSTNTGVYKTGNLSTVSPTWTAVYTRAQLEALTGFTMSDPYDGFWRVAGNITAQNLFFVKASLSAANREYVGHTHDGGTVWTWVLVNTAGRNEAANTAFDIGDHNATTVMFGSQGSDNYPHIWISTDGGHTFSVKNLFSYSGHGVVDLLIPYDNNSNDQVIYVDITGPGAGVGLLARSTDGGNSWSNISPPGRVRPGPPFALHAYTQDRRQIFHGNSERFYYSIDAGDNFTLRSTFDGSRAFGGFPYDGGRIYRLRHQNLGAPASGAIFTSGDGGYTWVDKTGDWGTAIGNFQTGIMIVPVWIAT